MSEEGLCDVCQLPATQKCGGCHVVFYCSKDHQKEAWKTHKKNCKAYKVCVDPTVGRHLVATRDIPPHHLILQEGPLVWGPPAHTVPVCVGCGATATKHSKPCSKCGWPVCGPICESAPSHLPECRYTVMRGNKVCIKNFGVPHPTYQCITVLRCLYLKQFLPEMWEKLSSLQSHCEERKKTARYENERVSIAQFILKFFKLENIFTEEDIMKVCGIIMVNSHEVPLTETPHIAIYKTSSMLEHSCRSNCSKSFTKNGEIVISSGTYIKKGEPLSICYTDPLWGTSNRRYHLYESKFFWCNCERCSDITEFGTYFDAVKCEKSGCSGYALPNTFLDNSNDKGPDWICNQCQTSISSYMINDLLERIGNDLVKMKKNDQSKCRNFIRTYEQLLHPNHYYLTDVKLALENLIGQQDGGLSELTDEDLELKAKLSQHLASLMTKLIPGEKRVRGLIFFDLHAAIAEIGKRRAMSEGNPEILNVALMEARKLLKECVQLLKFEPDVLPEGKICKQAHINLKDIENVFKTVDTANGTAFQ